MARKITFLELLRLLLVSFILSSLPPSLPHPNPLIRYTKPGGQKSQKRKIYLKSLTFQSRLRRCFVCIATLPFRRFQKIRTCYSPTYIFNLIYIIFEMSYYLTVDVGNDTPPIYPSAFPNDLLDACHLND